LKGNAYTKNNKLNFVNFDIKQKKEKSNIIENTKTFNENKVLKIDMIKI
jgi:hypothetical protein